MRFDKREGDDPHVAAWYDPRDAASANDPDWSWNWRLHDPQGTDPDGRKGFVEYTTYSEDFESVTLTTSVDGHRENGHYEWWNDSEDTAQYVLDYERGTQFHGGMWGAGTFGGPGAELETSAWKVRDVMTSTESWSSAHSLRYSGDGDYREYSIELLVRPWWEPWEWLRVFGSVGVEVSRREFEWSLSATGTDGSRYSESVEACDWRMLGLLGGGLSLQWRGFFLAGEALWRFGGDDLEVDGRAVRGGIERGDWGFRLSLGYEF